MSDRRSWEATVQCRSSTVASPGPWILLVTHSGVPQLPPNANGTDHPCWWGGKRGSYLRNTRPHHCWHMELVACSSGLRSWYCEHASAKGNKLMESTMNACVNCVIKPMEHLPTFTPTPTYSSEGEGKNKNKMVAAKILSEVPFLQLICLKLTQGRLYSSTWNTSCRATKDSLVFTQRYLNKTLVAHGKDAQV